MKDEVKPFDIWALIEATIADGVKPAGTATKTPAKKSNEEQAKSKKKLKRWVISADIVSSSFWVYALTMLFVIDLDGILSDKLGPSLSWILWFKSFLFLSLLTLLALFFWKWKTLAFVVYVLFYPVIVLVWKVPRLLYKSKSWIFVMGFVNAVVIGVKNFRYNLVSKSSSIIASVLIFSTSNKYVLYGASFLLILILFWAAFRTVKLTFQKDWFIKIHEQFITKVVDSKIVAGLTTLNDDIATGKVQKLDANQLATVTTSISGSMLINKGLYFWAYQLQKYKQSGMSIIFNAFTFVWLFTGTVYVFWLVNTAIFKIDPGQFNIESSGSGIAILVYSMSTLFLNDGAGISPAGTTALVVRLIAAVFGSIFLLTVVANILMVIRQSRDNASLEGIVTKLKDRAKKQDEVFKQQFSLSVDEARLKMEQLNQGIHGLIGMINAAIPSDFMSPTKGKKNKS